jgi:hypothetical protein
MGSTAIIRAALLVLAISCARTQTPAVASPQTAETPPESVAVSLHIDPEGPPICLERNTGDALLREASTRDQSTASAEGILVVRLDHPVGMAVVDAPRRANSSASVDALGRAKLRLPADSSVTIRLRALGYHINFFRIRLRCS